MLKIRLMKPGKSVKRRYHYKIVVIEAKRARDSRFVEQVGHYDPSRNILEFEPKSYEKWINDGAQPTVTVKNLFRKYTKASASKLKA